MSNLPEMSGKEKAVVTAGIGGAIAAGAVIGSIVPGPGTLIGAGIGAILGGAGVVIAASVKGK